MGHAQHDVPGRRREEGPLACVDDLEYLPVDNFLESIRYVVISPLQYSRIGGNMKLKVVALGCCIFLVATVLVLVLNPRDDAAADVGHTQQVVLVGDKPVSGSFKLRYKNYAGKYRICDDQHCVYDGMKVSDGTLEVRLTTYKVREGIDKLDYYLFDVDTVNAGRGGKSDGGWANVRVSNVKVKPTAFNDTKSVSAKEEDCKSVVLGMSTPWPWVSASFDLGSVRFCDDSASYRKEAVGSTAKYQARDLRDISSFDSERAVKVPAGKRPTFRVSFEIPVDVCTKVGETNHRCWEYDNRRRTKTFYIGTTG